MFRNASSIHKDRSLNSFKPKERPNPEIEINFKTNGAETEEAITQTRGGEGSFLENKEV